MGVIMEMCVLWFLQVDRWERRKQVHFPVGTQRKAPNGMSPA